MTKLTAEALRGIWAGVTMVWDEDYGFDEEIYAKNIERVISSKVHGIYTTGSTGEFYAMDFKEFQQMVNIEAELCGKAGMPLQIGCCADSTMKTIKLLEYAAGKKEVNAVQVNIPYWMELNDRELLKFFKDLYTACPDMPLVHYNIPRAKRFLTGENYIKILEVAPSLIGVKYTFAGSYFAQLQSDIMMTPGLSYFVGENMLVSAMQIGAQGCYSSVYATNPGITLDMYEKAYTGQWDEAIKIQQNISKFLSDIEAFLEERDEGLIDPVVDKGMAVASGFLMGHQRCRAPYIGFSDDTIIKLQAWMNQKYPEFVYSE